MQKILLFILIVLLSLLAVFYSYHHLTAKPPVATEVKPQSNQLSIDEYKKIRDELITIVNNQDPKAALEKLQSLISDNTIANSCHGLAHEIGHSAYDKYQNFTVAMQYNDEICGSGYIHGLIEERFLNTTNIYTELGKVCLPQNSGMCFHGVGHGFMYYTSNNIHQSLQWCDLLPTTDAQINCSDGVFMENFEGDHFLHPSKYLKPADPLYPCSEQTEFYKGSCYFYAPRYYLQVNKGQYKEALTWCQTAETGYKLICINGVGSATMKQNLNDPKLVEGICAGLANQTESSICLDGMISYYLTNYYSVSRAKQLCQTLSSEHQLSCEAAVKNHQTTFPN